MGKVLGFDIGGSAIKAGQVDTADGRLLAEPENIPLPRFPNPSEVLDRINSIVRGLNWTGPIGVGYPGVIKAGRTLSAAHMDDSWSGFDFLPHLRSLTPSAVAIINDADAAGLAEMRFGAGQDRNRPDGGTVLVVTLGTGIGTAFFHGGRLFPNTEFGHVEIGGFEAEDRAAAVVRVSQKLDWQTWGGRVNRYLEEMNKLISPDKIVLGGGVSENFSHFKTYLTVGVPVVPAVLGNAAGLVGAALAVESS